MTSVQSIGSIIRRIRWEKKLSQKDLATSLGVSAISIHSYEHEKRKPGKKVYTALIKLMPEFEVEIMNTLYMPGNTPSIIKKNSISEEENKVSLPRTENEMSLLAQSQQRTIELQAEKIKFLENTLKKTLELMTSAL